MVERADLYLSRALAAVFSACEIKNHHLRPLANSCAGWAGRGVTEIFKSRNAVTGLPSMPVLLLVADTSMAVLACA